MRPLSRYRFHDVHILEVEFASATAENASIPLRCPSQIQTIPASNAQTAITPLIEKIPTTGNSSATNELDAAPHSICIDVSRPHATPANSGMGSSAPRAALGATRPKQKVLATSKGMTVSNEA